MERVPYLRLHDELARVLCAHGFTPERADLCARLFCDSSRDGVHSHGINRFPRFIEQIGKGVVEVEAEAACEASYGAWERWHGHRGPGNLNAYAAMQRAVALSREFGMGGVALGHTNHWMRGGSYGWQAAEAGVIGICWTNTMPNLPPWGAADCRVGNNPLVVAAPRKEGHLVLDMALSQFSYGALESYRKSGRMLPVDGGFDRDGRLTRDPGAVEESRRPLPTGLWKGSGLSIMLDVIAAALSGGRATHQIEADPVLESGVSQVFIAIDPASLLGEVADGVVESLRGAGPAEDGGRAYYPGERTLERRLDADEHGVLVDPAVWRSIRGM